MEKLQGTEKQVKLAGDIRSEWAENIRILEERITVELTRTKRQAKKPITEEQKKVIRKAQEFFSKDNPTGRINGKPGHLRDLVAKIERAMEDEGDATYWIERR